MKKTVKKDEKRVPWYLPFVAVAGVAVFCWMIYLAESGRPEEEEPRRVTPSAPVIVSVRQTLEEM